MQLAGQPVLCLMGPTASGKTSIAVQLADAFPVDIVSVDSALVYRGMDIGTAKPDAETLRQYPHRLINLRDPEDSYSAGEFVRDAAREIESIQRSGRIPLLVGGTMLYFRALVDGIATLPGADQSVRSAIDLEAAQSGWPGLHRQLAEIDPDAAAKINPNDAQRIQRALEVYRLSGRRLSAWHDDVISEDNSFKFIKFALIPDPRSMLHERIALRLEQMLDAGFTDEMKVLMERPGLTSNHSSMRAVGYRQYWAHFAGESSLAEAKSKALAATRQLAKRQLTWLRSESDLFIVNPLESDAFATISSRIADRGFCR